LSEIVNGAKYTLSMRAQATLYPIFRLLSFFHGSVRYKMFLRGSETILTSRSCVFREKLWSCSQFTDQSQRSRYGFLAFFEWKWKTQWNFDAVVLLRSRNGVFSEDKGVIPPVTWSEMASLAILSFEIFMTY
jgi:hypothetical protein